MHRECKEYKTKKDDFLQPAEHTDAGEVWWWQWQLVQGSYKDKDGNAKTTKRTVKDKVQGTITKLKMECDKQLAKLATHVFNIKCQYRTCHLRKLPGQMSHEEPWLHTDFAENWTNSQKQPATSEVMPSSVITFWCIE